MTWTISATLPAGNFDAALERAVRDAGLRPSLGEENFHLVPHETTVVLNGALKTARKLGAKYASLGGELAVKIHGTDDGEVTISVRPVGAPEPEPEPKPAVARKK